MIESAYEFQWLRTSKDPVDNQPFRPGMSGPTGVTGVTGEVEDCGDRIEALLKPIGFDYTRGSDMLRIFGYIPKSMELFEG